MKQFSMLSCVAALLVSASCQAESWRLVVRNVSTEPREAEPVNVRLPSTIQKKLAGVALHLTGPGDTVFPCQADDLDGDGLPDELVFVDSFAPREPKRYTLSTGSTMETATRVTPGVAASLWKWYGKVAVRQDADTIIAPGTRGRYRFDGAGWESAIVGYRVYLDERNAVDVLGKRQPGFYWEKIGSTDVDYQLDNPWGMDVLHIGGAVGLGGIALWRGDTLVRPREVNNWTCTIVAAGPVRSVVRVRYLGWETGNGKVDIASLFVMYAGERLCEHRVVPGGPPNDVQIAAGLVRHPSAPVEWNHHQGWVSTLGRQSRTDDSLFLAIVYSTDLPATTMEDSLNYLVVCPLGGGVRFWILAAWQGEPGGLIGPEERDAVLRRAALRLRSPLDAAFEY